MSVGMVQFPSICWRLPNGRCEQAVLKCCSHLGAVQISEFAKVRGSSRELAGVRGRSRASVVLIFSMIRVPVRAWC